MESALIQPGLEYSCCGNTLRLKTKKDWIEIGFIFSYFDMV